MTWRNQAYPGMDTHIPKIQEQMIRPRLGRRFLLLTLLLAVYFFSSSPFLQEKLDFILFQSSFLNPCSAPLLILFRIKSHRAGRGWWPQNALSRFELPEAPVVSPGVSHHRCCSPKHLEGTRCLDKNLRFQKPQSCSSLRGCRGKISQCCRLQFP